MSQPLLADRETGAVIGSRLRWRRWLMAAAGGGLAAAAIAWFGIYWLETGQYWQSTDDAYVGGNVTDLAPKVSGLIARVDVTDNQFVKAGALLVKIDDRDYRAALARAQAAVAGDEAALDHLDATRRLQLSLIIEAQADIRASDAQIALARLNEARYRTLAATNAGSVQAAQTASSTFQQRLAGGEKAQAALAAAQAQLAVIETQKSQAKAALAGDRAALTNAKLNLGYTDIRAPIDGYIGNRSAELGGYASVGTQLLSLVPAQGLWVDANFKEDQLARMRPGDKATISADILPGQKITGHVGSLAPATGAVFSVLPAENATGNFTKIVQRVPVRIWLDGDAGALGLLRPGLSVTVDVDTK
ncbi:MAG TPA: HlyD family secretion protein [Acidocella sp.]|jgi:membrane fusion protein (multidrug efflux system)|uniref:HlyD family secretion protein n=1 Tax=Acidocella sp. TaxID=50710 RepID=UPI002C6E36BC|nr:HlyD family secretion protein [Acidocella sp.]HVE21667.1 HlyD family secretion protein [Acidocella sp.]